MALPKKLRKLDNLLQVSRETINSLNKYEKILLKNNKKFNLISKSSEKVIKIRHILDSAQVIDLIDKNCNVCVDLGSVDLGYRDISYARWGSDLLTLSFMYPTYLTTVVAY